MKVNILPADMKTVRIVLKNTSETSKSGHIALPQDIIRRHKLEDKDEIIIGFLCKADEDLDVEPSNQN